MISLVVIQAVMDSWYQTFRVLNGLKRVWLNERAIKAQFDVKPALDELPHFSALNLLSGLPDSSLRALNRSTQTISFGIIAGFEFCWIP